MSLHFCSLSNFFLTAAKTRNCLDEKLLYKLSDEKQTKASYDEVTFLLTEKLSVTDLQCLLCCRYVDLLKYLEYCVQLP